MQKSARGRSPVPPVLRRFGWWMAALTILSELSDWALERFRHLRPPYGGTWHYEDAGSDFYVYFTRFLHFRQPDFWDVVPRFTFLYPFSYPAPLAIVYWLWYRVPHGLVVYTCVSMALLATGTWLLASRLAAFGISRLTAFPLLLLFVAACWPVRYLLETGNMEAMVDLLLALGILAILRERWYVGAACLGLAGSMKIYPFMLVGLLLSQRKYRASGFAVLVAAVSTVASLAIVGPTMAEAQHNVYLGLKFIEERYVLMPVANGLQFSHSLFNFVKVGTALVARMHGARTASVEELRLALLWYSPIAATGGIALYTLRIRHMPMLNQVIALTILAVTLPPYSLDYTLVNLLLPLGLLMLYAVAEWREGRQPPGLNACFASFILILSTGAFFQLRYRFASQIRTLALLTLLGTVVRFAYPQPREAT